MSCPVVFREGYFLDGRSNVGARGYKGTDCLNGAAKGLGGSSNVDDSSLFFPSFSHVHLHRQTCKTPILSRIHVRRGVDPIIIIFFYSFSRPLLFLFFLSPGDAKNAE